MATKEEILFATRAVQWHLLGPAQVQAGLDLQKGLHDKGQDAPLAAILVKKGLLSRRDPPTYSFAS